MIWCVLDIFQAHAMYGVFQGSLPERQFDFQIVDLSLLRVWFLCVCV
jgi:hypothetical protein